MTDITTNQMPVTLASIYRSGLIAYMKRETRKSEKKYHNTLKKAKFPIDRRVKMHQALRNLYGSTETANSLMQVFALLMNDPSIGEPTLAPSTVGTCFVMVSRSQSGIGNNDLFLVSATGKNCFTGINSTAVSHNVYPTDLIRYATDEEIATFVDGFTNVMKTHIRENCVALRPLHDFAESQLVFSPTVESDDEPEVDLSDDSDDK